MNKADNIIIVDDDLGNIKVASLILQENGMEVTEAGSGFALLELLKDGAKPDLIMLDILMPEMDGFETYNELRRFEQENGLSETPVVFLTGDDSMEMEAKGFELGALDYIRKPFEPEVLLHRIQNILSNSRKISTLSEEATIDQLTGVYNKASVTAELERACLKSGGALMILDLDSFKLVNDIYGHEMGDKILAKFARIIKHHFRSNDILGRIGGDEFIAFLKEMDDRDAILRSINRLNSRFYEEAQKIIGQEFTIPLGVSAGAAMTAAGADYNTLFNRADQSLRYIKQNGKHGCFIWVDDDNTEPVPESDRDDMKRVNMILDERNVTGNAMLLGQEAFGSVYRYMLRYIKRYKERALKILFTLAPVSEEVREGEFSEAMEEFSKLISNSLRNSDIIMQSSSAQFFLLLPMVCAEDIKCVVERIVELWNEDERSKYVKLTYETECIEPEQVEGEDIKDGEDPEEIHVVVVDDDIMILKLVGNILSEDGMWVTALDSGEALLEYIGRGNYPDLILLDVMMPDPDGFETYRKLQNRLGANRKIPVIFLTGNSDEELEMEGLELGASDFIRKPIKTRILPVRVRHAIDMAKTRN